ncbi:MAG TPA: M48 family metallopeptidase [Candidatus Angelobacter sp.]|nr:M48 family metallopeptidase [Candidatus Angelobacter sp.]
MKLLGSLCLLALCIGISSHKAIAQTPASPGTSATPAAVQSAPATQTTQYTLPPDKLAKSKALYDLRGKLRIIGTIYGFAVLLVLLYLGVVARYRDWAEKATKFSLLQALIVIPLFMLTTTLLDLPLDAYEHSVSRQYGLSVQGWGSWISDVGKGFLVGAVISVVLLWLMIVIIRKSPRRWWFYFWFPAYAMFVLIIYGGPWFIDPLFNKFEPLEKNNPALVRHIEELTARSSLTIPRQRMFLMLASEKTNELNAYVTGFGASKRIVVWDTTIQKMSPPETLFVVGHEMGHYVLNHIIYGLLLLAIGLLIALYVIYLVSGWMLRRFGLRWHIRELGDWAALPMIFLILIIVGFFSSPIANSISRQMEHDADVYGLEVTHGINANSQEAGAHAFQVLGEVSLVYPHPSRFVTFWYGSHPSIPDRVPFAHNYDPWSKGEQPKYVK